jgi:ionotropic glutamate receptor
MPTTPTSNVDIERPVGPIRNGGVVNIGS